MTTLLCRVIVAPNDLWIPLSRGGSSNGLCPIALYFRGQQTPNPPRYSHVKKSVEITLHPAVPWPTVPGWWCHRTHRSLARPYFSTFLMGNPLFVSFQGSFQKFCAPVPRSCIRQRKAVTNETAAARPPQGSSVESYDFPPSFFCLSCNILCPISTSSFLRLPRSLDKVVSEVRAPQS